MGVKMAGIRCARFESLFRLFLPEPLFSVFIQDNVLITQEVNQGITEKLPFCNTAGETEAIP